MNRIKVVLGKWSSAPNMNQYGLVPINIICPFFSHDFNVTSYDFAVMRMTEEEMVRMQPRRIVSFLPR